MMALDLKDKSKTEAKQKIESKPIVENKPVAGPEGKSRRLWILIGAVTLAVFAGLTYLAFPYVMGIWSAYPAEKGVQNSRHGQVKTTLALDPFLVNLADADEARFLKTTFQLGLAKEPSEEARSPVAIAAMRDSIISLLSSKTAEQVLTPQGKDKLREEILSRVNAVSPQIKALEVYIVDFVVQL